jgi:flagellar motor switch protein FliG
MMNSLIAVVLVIFGIGAIIRIILNIEKLRIVWNRSFVSKLDEEYQSCLRINNFLSRIDADALFNAISAESPKRIAEIMTYMEPAKVPMVLGKLHLDVQIAVIRAIAEMEYSKAENPRKIEKFLKRKVIVRRENSIKRSGIEHVVDILILTDRNTMALILNKLEDVSPEFAKKIMNRIFIFEDIVMLSDQDIQKILKNVDTDTLSIALKSVDSGVQQKILSNMSKEDAQKIKDTMDFIGPVRKIDVEEAQSKIVSLIRKWNESNKLEGDL